MGGDQISRTDVRPILVEFKPVGVSVTSYYNYIIIMTLKL